MLLFLYLSVLSINMLVFKCEEMCNCQEIDLLKDTVQQVMLEQKLESAKLRKLEARQRSSSAGSPSAIFVDRLVKMEAKIADIDKTLNDIVQEKPEDKSENMEIILKKSLASEKLERVQFVSDIESQMTDMKETFEQFKIESNSIIGESIGNISATEKEMNENINEKFKEIKEQTDNLVRKVQTNVATLKGDMKSEVNEKLEDINSLNQRLNNVDKRITTLDNIAVKDKIDIESQMTDMKETFEQFKIESNSIIGESIGNISATEKEMNENINEKFKEIKEQTDNLVRKVQTNVATLKGDMKSEVNEKLEDINSLNQRLNKVDKRITTLDNIAVKDKIDGGWTHWGDWSSCSVSCGIGFRHKSRTCSSPSPSVLGRQCEGNSIWTDTCGSKRCPVQRVAFTAYGIKAGYSTDVVTFPNIIEKIGYGYSSTTGKFTCSIPGIYHFVVTLSIKKYSQYGDVLCYIYLNSISKVELYAKKSHGRQTEYSFPATAAVVLHLNRGDTVYVGGCGEYDSIYDDRSTNFMGFLVSADYRA